VYLVKLRFVFQNEPFADVKLRDLAGVLARRLRGGSGGGSGGGCGGGSAAAVQMRAELKRKDEVIADQAAQIAALQRQLEISTARGKPSSRNLM
jgi:hypothetical protein